ncbi:hypothetical protein H257_03479 [Aphanomyces astaci]|uniref:Uncharacterized protein n=1 Tax=Aphanomyces astaci TaxID=112090 RepID=W4GXZ2_APHAT|nr:hypothetical protein H257_03479 [Aphanomyces astaci]ETV84201.1 hypothetical protein H257_03479 [Aphanomyces astaci]|eukprot:XP_009825893.1 hypothetical protein H257_03479 [Aphanomyces astaci]
MEGIGDTLPRRTPPPRPANHPKETLLRILKHAKSSADPSAQGLLSVESPRPRVTSSAVKHHRSHTPLKLVQVPLSSSTTTATPQHRQLFHRQQKHKPAMIQINPVVLSEESSSDSSANETTMLHRRLLHAATAATRHYQDRRGTATDAPPRVIAVPFRHSIQVPSFRNHCFPR